MLPARPLLFDSLPSLKRAPLEAPERPSLRRPLPAPLKSPLTVPLLSPPQHPLLFPLIRHIALTGLDKARSRTDELPSSPPGRQPLAVYPSSA